ncbi:MAG: acyl carrier protein [Bryobacterales bacterium]|nr:acyl carrier protein [Bryobacterales bacterium]
MLTSLGLGGDGDEIDAIEDVEREFGIALDKADAPHWLTVGDVYQSLLKALPEPARQDSIIWPRFCAAICQQTGADGTRVSAATLLI